MPPDSCASIHHPLRRKLWFALAAVVCLGAVTLWVMRRDTQPLTADNLRQAQARWKQSNVSTYILEIEVRGAQHGDHRIQVQDGHVVGMTTGGRQVAESVWNYWTMEGLFRQLEEELLNATQPQQTYGVAAPSQILLRIEFDAELGYPSYFLRHVSGTQKTVEWIIRRFKTEP